MESILSFFISVNKVALLAFVVVLGFLLYELYLYRKEKQKGKKPSVPQFVPSAQTVTTAVGAPVVQASAPAKSATPLKKTSGDQPKVLLVIGVLTILIVVSVFLYFFITRLGKKKTTITTVPVVREVSSAGLKIFNKDWTEIKNGDRTSIQIKPGDTVYIGIQTIEEADIDRARIKVNKTEWDIKDITTTLNPKLKVYYKEYLVATGTAQLKIDAQLHSTSDGWLGD